MLLTPQDWLHVRAFVRFRDHPPIETRADAFDWMTMCLAGHAAQLLLCPDVVEPLLDPTSVDAVIVEDLAAQFSPPLIPIRFMVDSARIAASKTVERDQVIITRVAEALDQAGRLSAGEIAAIVAGA
jgi:hypothetical protein